MDPHQSSAKWEKPVNSVVAKTEDGSIQISFTIPFEIVKQEREASLKEYAKEMEIPGFRRGMAPIEKVAEKVPAESLVEHTLRHILPRALADAIVKHAIKPAIYPKFELVSAKEGEDWQVRAITCELPEVDLGDYKKTITGTLRAKNLWTPDKAKAKGPDLTKEEKEQEIIKVVLDTVKIKIPHVLIEEEVNARLSSLLEKIEKLGLSLESYLASLGKNPETLRGEYALQAKNTITLDLALEKIATEEKITADEAKIDETIKASSEDEKIRERLNTPEQRRLIAGVLRRRSALDYLASLV